MDCAELVWWACTDVVTKHLLHPELLWNTVQMRQADLLRSVQRQAAECYQLLLQGIVNRGIYSPTSAIYC